MSSDTTFHYIWAHLVSPKFANENLVRQDAYTKSEPGDKFVHVSLLGLATCKLDSDRGVVTAGFDNISYNIAIGHITFEICLRKSYVNLLGLTICKLDLTEVLLIIIIIINNNLLILSAKIYNNL